MNITLGAEFERRIAEKVETGLYTSASEVIRDGLRLLFEKDQVRENQIAALQQEISKGFAQLDTGNIRQYSVHDIFQKAKDLHDGQTS